jgi:Flp pilus assembly protein TadG
MRSQRGSAAVEFTLLVPVLVLLFSLLVGGGRVWLARSSVETMAGAAARAASLERDAGSAEAAAQRLVTTQAGVSGLRCVQLAVRLEVAALNRPAGTPGSVHAAVDCTVPLADILVPGWPGELLVSADASAVVDRYRGRK